MEWNVKMFITHIITHELCIVYTYTYIVYFVTGFWKTNQIFFQHLQFQLVAT